jgi:hypothetical protein
MRVPSKLFAMLRWGGLLAGVALLAVGVSSGWWSCTVYRNRQPGTGITGVDFTDGGVEVWTFGDNFGSIKPGISAEFSWRYPPRWGWWVECGDGIFVPLWIPTVLLAAPTSWLWYRRLRYRFGPGRCPKCGYDRVGLAAEVACPECGCIPQP